MITNDRVGCHIQVIRKHIGQKQPELAEKIGRSFNGIFNLERGISLHNIETLERSCEHFVNVTKVIDFARQLDDEQVEIAVEQIGAMTTKARVGKK